MAFWANIAIKSLVPPNPPLLVPRACARHALFLLPIHPRPSLLPPTRLRPHQRSDLHTQRMVRHDDRLRRNPLLHTRIPELLRTTTPPPLRNPTRRLTDPRPPPARQIRDIQDDRAMALVRLSATTRDQ